MKQFNKLKTMFICLLFTAIGISVGAVISILANMTQTIAPILGPLISLVTGFSIPIITTFIFQQPRLSVEISSIQRKISDNAKIYIDNYSEFSVLKDGPLHSRRPRFFFPGEDLNVNPLKGLSVVELDELISMTKKELKDLPEIVEKRKTSFDRVASINVADFKIYEADKFNEPLGSEVKFERKEFDEKKDDILRQFVDKYQKLYEEVEKRYNQLNAAMPVIERKVEQIKEDIIAQRSYFSISTTLMNSGRLNTSVRKPALLRVYIGQGNYIDLKLIMKDFESKSDINFQSTKIVEFESSEISALPEDDRKLINTYWGQSVSAILFLEDIYSSIHSSNTISFAEGLYQKLIYDELAISAGKKLSSK